MKRLFKLKHPKLIILFLSIILAYLLFKDPSIQNFILQYSPYGYINSFVAGFLFSFGFTTPFAIGLFLNGHLNNIFLTTIIGGVGATLSTLFMFKWLKFSFEDEIEDLEKEYYFKKLILLIDKEIPHKIRVYLSYTFIGLILASPIPNEFATLMLAGMKKIKIGILTILTMITSSIGIYIILLFN